MEPRINVQEKGVQALKAMLGVSRYLSQSPVEQELLHLLYMRVSQMNGCAYCLDMHAKDLRAAGVPEQRIYLLNAWREAPLYSGRERAALAWAEAVTLIRDGSVPEAVFEAARSHFSEAELVDLTLAVTTINSYNRLNIAFRTVAGSYEPGMYATQ